MDAPDLLQHLRAAGLALTVEGDRLIVKPRERLTDPDRDAIRAYRDDLVRLLSCALTPPPMGDDIATPPPLPEVPAVPSAPAPAPNVISTSGEGADALLLLRQRRHPRPTAPAWSEVEVTHFAARTAALARRGFGQAEAERVSELLIQRDRAGDDRRMCIECTHLGDRGRCLAAAAGRLRSADRRLEPVSTVLHRCEGFGLRKTFP